MENSKTDAQLVQGTQWSAATWGLLMIVSGALFLDGIDLSMVNIALPSIGAELKMSTGALQWIVNAYILGYGGFLLLGGRAADLLGRRQVFLSAVAIFGVASLISAFTDNALLLIALRFIKGVSAGFTVPAGMSIVTTSFSEGSARNKALMVYSITGTLGFALGLVLGGVFTGLGWRATLFMPGPVALLLFFLGLKLIPQARKDKVSFSQFDIFGALTMTGALLLSVYALVEASEKGWTSSSTITMLAISLALMVAFIFVELRHRHPLVRLGILRSMSLVHANISAALILGSFMAFQFLVSIYLQDSLKWAPFAVALAFLPSSLPVAFFGPKISAYFSSRGNTAPILIGLSLVSVGYLLLLRIDPASSYWVGLFPTMLLVGFGFAFGLPAIYAQSAEGVQEVEQGLASGLVNTSFQVGGAISLAIVAGALSSGKLPVVQGQLLPNMQSAILIFSAIAILGVVLTFPV